MKVRIKSLVNYLRSACSIKRGTAKFMIGFTLLEAMIASAVMALGFAGVVTLIAASEQFTQRAIARQKMQMIANQMLEIMATDTANLASYGMNLTTCTAPTTSNQWDVRGFEWCTRLEDEVGAAGTTNTRSITITTITGDRRLVSILLESNNQTVMVTMRKVFDV